MGKLGRTPIRYSEDAILPALSEVACTECDHQDCRAWRTLYAWTDPQTGRTLSAGDRFRATFIMTVEAIEDIEALPDSMGETG